MKIALAQINSHLGDFKKNGTKIKKCILKASENDCQLIVFPECSLFGYHPFDLLENKHFVHSQLKELNRIHRWMPNHIAALVGIIRPNENKKGRPYYNSVALLRKGKKVKYFDKELLPTGDVFDEARFFEKGSMRNNFFTLNGKRVFLSICEDMWAWPDRNGCSIYSVNPMKKVPHQNVDLAINMSASPYYPGKLQIRHYHASQMAQHFNSLALYLNLVGAQDELIFDGASFLIDRDGRFLLNAMKFQEDLLFYEIPKTSEHSLKHYEKNRSKYHKVGKVNGEKAASFSEANVFMKSPFNRAQEIKDALVLGIRDFCSKIGIQKVHIGLSGGIDSALVACLAVEALGAEFVHSIYMPGPYSSELSLKLAVQLSDHLKIKLLNIPIQSIYKMVSNDIKSPFQLSDEITSVQQNLQARIRGIILMAYSNQFHSLLLNTGNKSEYATGYCTLYGDMCGGLAPIGDLTKTQVIELCRLYNRIWNNVIPEEIIQRPPTAELKPDQLDEDDLPPYSILDPVVDKMVGKETAGSSKIEKWLLNRLLQSEFKRWQAPPILKVSQHSFGRGRRWPISVSIKN